MNYRDIKKLCDEKIKEYPEYTDRYKKEIIALKRFANNGIDIYQEFQNKKEKIDNRYVVPFLLGFTKSIDIEKPMDMIQVKEGASGGVDVDVDLSPLAKEKVTEYLKNKFGEERVLSVGTYTKMGVASAAKDLMRIYEVPFKESNAFTSELNSQETWQENLERLKFSRPDLYATYEKYKEVLDLTPYFINKVRQCLPYYQQVDIYNNLLNKEDKKEIEKINAMDDYIVYLDIDGNKQYTKNYKVFNSGIKKIYEITTNKGNKIRASGEHRFFLKNGTVKMLKDLKDGDEIITK